MFRLRWDLRGICLGGFCFLCLTLPLYAQGLRTVIEPREKVFPQVGAGVTGVKRDPSGRYYVLAKPATSIAVYSADGSLIDHFPNAKSSGVAIRYAVDLDLTSDGELVVADRGENAIDVFRPDGSLVSRIPVVAPTSVVALSDNQFAVTSLVSKRLVQVLNDRGKVIRSFGDPSDIDDDKPAENPAPKEALADLGRISGDSAGGIYFAFSSVPDPTVRKYDRYGYVGYESSIPESVFTAGRPQSTDRLEFSLGFSDVSLSNQTTGFATLGSSGDLKFGGGVGMGLSNAVRRGFSPAAIQQTMSQPGMGGGPFGAMFTGDVSAQGTSFQVGMGSMTGMGGRGRGRSNFGTLGDQTTSQGALLQFNSSGDTTDSDSSDSIQGTSSVSGTTGELGMFGYPDSGTSSGSSSYSASPGNSAFGMGGLPAGFVFGSAFHSFAFRPGDFGGGPPGVTGTAGPDHAHAGAGGGASGATGPRAEEASHFGYHGHRYSGMFAFTGTMRVNLGDLGRAAGSDKPVITAMAADPQTQEIWAGIGDTLVHFSKDGGPIGIYYLALKGGTPLKPTALLVEPDRILVAADPWGVFEFARPDKPAPAGPPQLNVVPQVTSPQQ